MSNDSKPAGDGGTSINLSPAPYEKAVDTATKGAVEVARAFLSTVCLPALEEVGGIAADRVSHWRKLQMLRLTQKWERKLLETGGEGRHAPPRLIETGLERGSLVDSEELSDMWAGLLASSCTEDGMDDSNLLFMNLLDQLTIPQAKILNYACKQAIKKVSPFLDLIYAEILTVDLETLRKISEINDVQRLDRELDYLRAIELLKEGIGGFPLVTDDMTETEAASYTKEPQAEITPSSLALHFYIRCQGSLVSPSEFYGLEKKG